MAAGLFDDLIGQRQAVALLMASIERRRLAPAYLLTGPHGVGRRLAALRFIEGVVAGPAGDLALRRRLEAGNHPDLLWVEPTYSHQGRLVPRSQALDEGVSRRTPPQLRLEQVREVSRFLARSPVEARGCMVVLDGAESMAEAAANALLKTLEEPGDGLLLLISAAPEQLLGTIRSRCQTVPLQRLAPAELALVLERCAAGTAEPDPSEAVLPDPAGLAELAAGSPGALLEHRRQWQQLPADLAQRLLQLALQPRTLVACAPLELLQLASRISQELDGEQQLWLLQWWQQLLWRSGCGTSWVGRLDRLRAHLLGSVQPRLAWEVALLDLARL